MPFKRGNGPLVSILLPTRGRPQWLRESIDSLYSLAQDKSCMEFILKVDDDDKETIETARQLSEILPLKFIISSKGAGYFDMHHWVNDMSKLATGDWLFLFNDDAVMQTERWDDLLLNFDIMTKSDPSQSAYQNPGVCLFIAESIGRKDAYEFIFLRRKVFEILGHFTLSPHSDSYAIGVMATIKSAFKIPIQIRHFSELAEDATRIESKAAYITTGPTLTTSPIIRAIINDALKLQDYIDSMKGEE